MKNDLKQIEKDFKRLLQMENESKAIVEFDKLVDKTLKKTVDKNQQLVLKEIKSNEKLYYQKAKSFYKNQGTINYYSSYLKKNPNLNYTVLEKDTTKYLNTLMINVSNNSKASFRNAIAEKQAILASDAEISGYKMIRDLVNKYGRPTFTFSNGRRYPAQSYFEMTMRGLRTRQDQMISQGLASSINTDLYYYSGVGASADRCIPLVGQIVSYGTEGEVKNMKGQIKQIKDLYSYGYGRADGPLGANCRHSLYPVVDGLFI